MKTSTLSSLFLCVFLFSSCGISNRLNVLKSGTVSTSNFVDAVPFDFSRKIPFINVKIAEKEYRFLFDTGAPCVISTELYEQLGLKKATTSKIGDSNGNKRKQIYTKLDEILIGDTSFKDIGAVVMDLNTSEIFECLALDGIIGANLMRTAKWEIDYQTNTLRFSDDIKNLNIEGENHVLNFSPVRTGTPHIDITVDSVTVKGVTFDTGSSGYITLPAKYFKNMYPDSDSRRLGYGVTSYGAFGASDLDTSFYIKTKSITIDKLSESNKMIELENHNKEILGNLFLKNYRVIMDWDYERITLYPILDDANDNENLRTFGFREQFANQKVTISYIFYNSAADKAGLKIGDEIIEIAGQKITGLNASGRCDLLFKSYEDLDKIALVVLRKSKEMRFSLEKNSLF